MRESSELPRSAASVPSRSARLASAEASSSRPVPSERAKIKAIPKVKLTEAVVPRPASLEKAKGKAELPKSPRVKKAQPPLVGSAGRALSLVGASAKASRSVSPLPVSSSSAAKAKGRSETLAPAEAKSSAILASERPLIALGRHKKISHERAGRRGRSFVPAGNITVLRRLQDWAMIWVWQAFHRLRRLRRRP